MIWRVGFGFGPTWARVWGLGLALGLPGPGERALDVGLRERPPGICGEGMGVLAPPSPPWLWVLPVACMGHGRGESMLQYSALYWCCRLPLKIQEDPVALGFSIV